MVLQLPVIEFELAAALTRAGHLTEAEALSRIALQLGAATVLHQWSEEWLATAGKN
jgi:hypothetical protein